ncbi:DUF7168 domain-containing protein [Enterococcus lactis]|uniref:DUF7168 domain-containing protein n=1 Tax=Enterococcus lactis TaxID=357441 RepID=UPI0040417EEF
MALAADANDEESMSALAKAQQLMMDYALTEDEVFNYHEQQRTEAVETHVIYRGRPQKWLYRLASIIAQNFRTEFYYREGSPIDLCFTGLASDVQIAELLFNTQAEVSPIVQENICSNQRTNARENDN